jgi:hypothetical protein
VSRALRWIGIGLLVLALLACAWNGLREGSRELHNDDTPAMRVATVTQLLYGALAVLALLALAVPAWRRRVFPLLICWAVATTLTGGLAPVVYGGSSLGIGVAAGALTALIAGGLVWVWHRVYRSGGGT